ncbi:hypothetical protein TWF281_008547 [Arthrobotrys megalospora]
MSKDDDDGGYLAIPLKKAYTPKKIYTPTMITSNPPLVERIHSPEPTPFLPSYTPSTTLPPAYTTHRSDRLLLTSSSSSSSPQPTSTETEEHQQLLSATHPKTRTPIFTITAHLGFKLHNPLHLLHKFLLTFLLINTALFALLVYNLDQTAIVADVGAVDGICVCPIKGGAYECYADGIDGFERVFSIVEYEKLEIWRQCVREVWQVREWREWVLWVVMPAQCVVETVVAWAWWWCLNKEEEEEEQEEEEEEERERLGGEGGREKVEV